LQHNKIIEQKSPEPLTEDGQHDQTNPDVYMLDALTDVIHPRLFGGSNVLLGNHSI